VPQERDAEVDLWGSGFGPGKQPAAKLIPPTPMGNHPAMDWGPFPHADADKGDYQLATWACERLKLRPADRPLLLAAGFFLPHVPCHAPPAWFARLPTDDTLLPPAATLVRGELPRFGWYLHWNLPEPRLKWLREHDQWRNLCRSYLACTTFVDAQIGRLLDAIDEQGLTDNTLVVLFSDHGFHLGEKQISGKNTLWERSTRVPLILAGPGVAAGAVCQRPVELLDVYPTLCDLCGAPAPAGLEGVSLRPWLVDANARRARPAITTHNRGNHAVRSERWRLIAYADGSEELYDHASDPHETRNLAGLPDYAEVRAEHRRWLPQINLPPAPGSAHRVLTYDPETDLATWEGTAVSRESAIPE
jgi:arylsulfatase A-like enzyme